MRRALSLIAFGATLFTASAQTLGLGTIRAVDTDAVDKDSWSVKGATIEGVSFSDLSGLVTSTGISAELRNFDGDTVDTVDFAEEDCKFLSNEKGVVCKIKGARVSIRLFTSISRTKAAAIESKHNKTSGGKDGLEKTTLTFWKVAGSAKGRDFAEDITDSGLTLSVVGVASADANDCEEKVLAHGQQRLTCVPVE